ncbi:MAG: hypothetical protein F4234_05420 [Gammaproteobacteria bacterium]|nr:hypothetical protein [Gammaproteobacteria bacterium]MYE99603.1 hypothetical protein [Gammaproteobacteria bacterium]MYG96536.1 hypothetical protein [Gammaproteobacteria bacterium]
MSIQERQNLPESLDKLAAQRLLYRKAKLARNFRMSIVLFIAVIALVAAFVQFNEFSYGVTLAALFAWFLDQIFIKEFEVKNKREAAVIQEDFDCFVLDIPWPHNKRESRPARDRIKQLAMHARKNLGIVKDLEDWYTPNELLGAEGKIYCQRMNCWWDVNLRKRWRAMLAVAFWTFVTIAILVSVFSGISVANLLALVAATLGILGWGVAEWKEQGSAVTNVQGIHQMLEEIKTELNITSEQVRRIQDEIFEHRRTNPPIPEWFYWLNRDHQEAEAANP